MSRNAPKPNPDAHHSHLGVYRPTYPFKRGDKIRPAARPNEQIGFPDVLYVLAERLARYGPRMTPPQEYRLIPSDFATWQAAYIQFGYDVDRFLLPFLVDSMMIEYDLFDTLEEAAENLFAALDILPSPHMGVAYWMLDLGETMEFALESCILWYLQLYFRQSGDTDADVTDAKEAFHLRRLVDEFHFPYPLPHPQHVLSALLGEAQGGDELAAGVLSVYRAFGCDTGISWFDSPPEEDAYEFPPWDDDVVDALIVEWREEGLPHLQRCARANAAFAQGPITAIGEWFAALLARYPSTEIEDVDENENTES